MGLPDVDWLGFCRRAAGAARDAVAGFETTAERAVETGRGGGPVRVVVDPIDGSLNAKRGLPSACLSIAVASGPDMSDVELGYVAELDRPREWWARRGEGAWCDGQALARLVPGPLEVLGLETARPALVAAAADAITAVEARRLRVLGSVALSLCLVGAGRFDAMVSLRGVRSVDAAAGQLLVREAGGAVAFPGGHALDLGMRSRVLAARDPALLERLHHAFEEDSRPAPAGRNAPCRD